MNPPQVHRFATKGQARAWGLDVRRSLSVETLDAISRDTCQRLLESEEFRRAGTLFTYVGALPGELDTRPILEEAFRDRKTVLVPVTRPAGVLAWGRLTGLQELQRNRYGLLEPRADQIDRSIPTGGLCIVPGICFRADGHRIGYGGGYYDRFLRDFSGVSIALTPAVTYGVEFPVEPHDQPVDHVITERAV